MNIILFALVYLNFIIATSDKPSTLTRIGRSLSRTLRGIRRSISRNKDENSESKKKSSKKELKEKAKLESQTSEIKIKESHKERESRRPPMMPNAKSSKSSNKTNPISLDKSINLIEPKGIRSASIEPAFNTQRTTQNLPTSSKRATFEPINVEIFGCNSINDHEYESIKPENPFLNELREVRNRLLSKPSTQNVVAQKETIPTYLEPIWKPAEFISDEAIKSLKVNSKFNINNLSREELKTQATAKLTKIADKNLRARQKKNACPDESFCASDNDTYTPNQKIINQQIIEAYFCNDEDTVPDASSYYGFSSFYESLKPQANQ
jgi:Sec-independent protein translocase protein TatA